MKIKQATFLQVFLAAIIVLGSITIPGVKKIILENIRFMIVAISAAGIFYIQLIKLIKQRERNLKDKIKSQSHLIENLLGDNSMNTRLIRDIAIPGLFEYDAEELARKLENSGLTLAEMNRYGIDEKVISQYELLYYLKKAKEKQETLRKQVHAKRETGLLAS